jgi:hypothetical protein
VIGAVVEKAEAVGVVGLFLLRVLIDVLVLFIEL